MQKIIYFVPSFRVYGAVVLHAPEDDSRTKCRTFSFFVLDLWPWHSNRTWARFLYKAPNGQVS